MALLRRVASNNQWDALHDNGAHVSARVVSCPGAARGQRQQPGRLLVHRRLRPPRPPLRRLPTGHRRLRLPPVGGHRGGPDRHQPHRPGSHTAPPERQRPGLHPADRAAGAGHHRVGGAGPSTTANSRPSGRPRRRRACCHSSRPGPRRAKHVGARATAARVVLFGPRPTPEPATPAASAATGAPAAPAGEAAAPDFGRRGGKGGGGGGRSCGRGGGEGRPGRHPGSGSGGGGQGRRRGLTKRGWAENPKSPGAGRAGPLPGGRAVLGLGQGLLGLGRRRGVALVGLGARGG